MVAVFFNSLLRLIVAFSAKRQKRQKLKDKKRNRFALVVKGNCYDLQQVSLFYGKEKGNGL